MAISNAANQGSFAKVSSLFSLWHFRDSEAGRKCLTAFGLMGERLSSWRERADTGRPASVAWVCRVGRASAKPTKTKLIFF